MILSGSWISPRIPRILSVCGPGALLQRLRVSPRLYWFGFSPNLLVSPLNRAGHIFSLDVNVWTDTVRCRSFFCGDFGYEAFKDVVELVEARFSEAFRFDSQEEFAEACAYAWWYSSVSCFHPVPAWRTAVRGASGKLGVSFSRVGSLDGSLFYLPCGKCIGCRLERSRVWAIRCLHEAKMHRENCFVTLTYDVDNLPADGSLRLRDYQLFLKRLRKFFELRQKRVRFYGCGEYGKLSKRPHYHLILFGVDFDDKRLYGNPEPHKIYTSLTLDLLWQLGSCKIGEVNFDTAAYVARYCVDKVDGPQRDAGHYLVYDMDGVVSERLPEFATMSRRPGLASAYYDKYGSEIRAHDSIIVKGREVPSIRYYDLKFEALDYPAFEAVKQGRKPEIRNRADWLVAQDEKSSRRRWAKEKVVRAALKLKKRIV